MSALARRLVELGIAAAGAERLAGGDLSEVLLVTRPDGHAAVAKSSRIPGAEASMLRALAAAGVPTPGIEAEHDGLLLLEYLPNDAVFSPRAWRAIGEVLAHLHSQNGEDYGWPVDYELGTVALPNRPARDWPTFWAEQRLLSTAATLDRPVRERVERLAASLTDQLPASPEPVLLHGDLWTGNILMRDGEVAALIDPAAYHGHAEVDLAMLTLFAEPPDDFWSAYGNVEFGWEARQPIYQLFPALVHLRLFGGAYASMVDRLLAAVGA